MEHIAPPAPLLADTTLAFTPVPQQRHRADGWTPETQANFIRALSAMGSVGRAARAVGMGRASAYRLRERPEAKSFAAAWDSGISMGRTHQFSIAMDRALNGVTTVRVLKGGAIDVSGGPDMAVVNAVLRDDSFAKATKETE
ncbi:hypothetical protein [Sphingopyxis sp.]|uniref:hypothetical protein n=1 Tax=Sphingopyxis sp. TaxID=1908224 RepID=UPI003D6DA4FB